MNPFPTLCLALVVLPTSAPAGAPSKPPGDAPVCSTSLRLPDSALDLELTWRQLDTDLTAFHEDPRADATARHRLRIMALLAFEGLIESDMTLHAGGQRFRSGRLPFAFTIRDSGRPSFFIVNGQVAVPLPSEERQPGWISPRMLLQLVYVNRQEVHLMWHIGEHAGAIPFRLGAQVTRPGAPTYGPGSGDDAAAGAGGAGAGAAGADDGRAPDAGAGGGSGAGADDGDDAGDDRADSTGSTDPDDLDDLDDTGDGSRHPDDG